MPASWDHRYSGRTGGHADFFFRNYSTVQERTISAQYVLFSKLLPQTIAASPAPAFTATFFHSFPVCTSNIPEKLSNTSLNLTFRILIIDQREIRIPVTDGRTHPWMFLHYEQFLVKSQSQNARNMRQKHLKNFVHLNPLFQLDNFVIWK